MDMVAIWRFLSGARVIILTATVLCTAVALYFAITATLIYRGETVIAPVSRNGGINGSGSLGGQLGGLAGIASLAGVNLDSASSSDREAKAILQSRSLVAEFIQRNDLVGELLQGESKQTLWLAVKAFKEGVLTIKEDKRTGLTTIDVDWKSAAVAAKWANGFVALANERIRARAIDEATRNIAFLTKQISQTNVVEIQHALYSLVENETKTLMLANARVEYAFTVIDPAVPPERKFGPKRSLMVLGGILAGLALGVIIAYVRSAMARLKASIST